MLLFADKFKAKDNPNLVRINGVQGLSDLVGDKEVSNSTSRGVVEAFLTSDFSISTGADYGASGMADAEKMFNDALQMVKGFGSLLADAGKNYETTKGISGQVSGLLKNSMHIKTLRNTILNWNSSGNLQFSVPLLFVALHKGDDVRKVTRMLLAACLPQGEATNFTATVGAPNGYLGLNVKNVEGLMSLNIGTWFRTNRVLLLESANFDYSKEIMKDTGFPLYAQGTLTFKTYRMMFRKELLGMLS